MKCEDSTEFYDLNLDLVLLENNRPPQRPQLNVPPAIDPFGLGLGLGGGGSGRLRSALLQGLGGVPDSSSLVPSLGGPSLSSARLMTMLTGRRRNAISGRRSDDGDDDEGNAIEGTEDAWKDEMQFDSSATGSDAGTMPFLRF